MYIPKADGRQRPLGIASLEDKVLQRAVVEVLNAIYETDFVGFSYGFRSGRSPHDDEAFRRRIGRQLNLGESLNDLRRFIFFAHRGKVRYPRHDDQTTQALSLIHISEPTRPY